VSNATNLARKDKPRGAIGNAAETIKLLASASPRLAGHPRQADGRSRLAGRHPGAHCPGTPHSGIRIPRIPDLLRQTGAWLFRRNDAEAGWRHWEITERQGGLSRLYRDTRFDVLHQLYDVVSGLHPAQLSDEQP
jgi:hypothetical protein